MIYRIINRTRNIITVFLLGIIWLNAYSQTDPETIMSEVSGILDKAAEYNHGESQAWQKSYMEVMREIHRHPDLLPQVEMLMIDKLKPNASFYGKQFICRELAVYGTGASVKALSRLLKDEETVPMALMALRSIEDPTIDKTLLKAVSKAKGKNKAGIINTLGARKTEEAVDMLSKLIFDEDFMIANAAINSLGEIGAPDAVEALLNAMGQSRPPVKWEIARALNKIAGRLDTMVNDEEALEIYTRVFESDPPIPVKKAAFAGKIRNLSSSEKYDEIIKLLHGPSSELQAAIIPLVNELSINEIRELIKNLKSFRLRLQMQIMAVLADEKIREIHRFVGDALDHPDKDMRLAALDAMLSVGTKNDIPMLAGIAAEKRGREKEMARNVLYRLPGKEIEKAILVSLNTANPAVQEELLRSIGERNMTSEVETVLSLTKDPERSIRVEAMRVLSMIADPAHLSRIIKIAVESESGQVKKAAVNTITSIAMEIQEKENRSEEILKFMPRVNDQESREMLIEILGNLGNSEALPVLRENLERGSEDTQYAVIRALSNWPDAQPMNDLKKLIVNTSDPKKHVLGMRGYVRMIQINDEMTDDEKTEALREAFQMAINTGEKRTIVSGLGSLGSMKALNMAVELLEDDELKAEARVATLDIAPRTADDHPEETKKILRNLLDSTEDERFQEEIRERLEWID